MKRVLIVLMAAVLLLTGLAGCGDPSGEAVAVQAVSMIISDGTVGLINRYAGVVVSGQTAEIKKETNKTVAEVFVEEGDWVNEGDTLFTYDMDAMELALTKLELELLLLFLRKPNKVFAREELLKRCWPSDTYVLDRTVDVNITRLRKKIGRYGKQIKTRFGYGYTFKK